MAQRRYLIISEKHACQVRIYTSPRHYPWLFDSADAKYNSILKELQPLLTEKINTEGVPWYAKPKVPKRDFQAGEDWEATVYLSENFINHYVFNRYQEVKPKKKKDWREELGRKLREEFGWKGEEGGEKGKGKEKETEKGKGKGKGKERAEEENERAREKLRRDMGNTTIQEVGPERREAWKEGDGDREITTEDLERAFAEHMDVDSQTGKGKEKQDDKGPSKDMDDRLKFKDQSQARKGPIKRRRIRTTDPRLKKQDEKDLEPQHYASSKRKATVEAVPDEDDIFASDEDELRRKKNLVPTEEEIENAWQSTMKNLPDDSSESEDDFKIPGPGEDPALMVDLIESEEESEDEVNEDGEVKPKLRMVMDGYETFWKTICLIVTRTDLDEKRVEHQRAVGKEVERMLVTMPNLNDGQPKDLWEEFGNFDLVDQDGKIIKDQRGERGDDYSDDGMDPGDEDL